MTRKIVLSYWERMPPAVQMMLANITFTAVTFLTGVITARALMPDGRGQFATLTIWATTIGQIGLLGMHHFLSRRGAQKREEVRSLYGLGYRIILGLTPILIALYVLGIWLLSLGHSGYGWLVITLSALVIPGSAANSFQMYMELGRQSFGSYNFCRISFAVAFFLFSMVLYFIGYRKIEGYLFAFMLATNVSAVVAMILINIRISKFNKSIIKLGWLDVLKKSRSYGSAILFTSLATQGDKLLLSLLFPASALGLFVVASSVASALHAIGEAFAQLFFARFVSYRTVEEIDREWLACKLRQTAIIYWLIAGSAMLVLPTLLPIIYGAAFAAAGTALIVLLPAVAVRAMVRPYEEIFRGLGRPNVSIAILASGVAVMMCSMLIVSRFEKGFIAISLCVLAGNIISLLVALVNARKTLNLRVTEVLWPRPGDLIDVAKRVLEIIAHKKN